MTEEFHEEREPEAPPVNEPAPTPFPPAPLAAVPEVTTPGSCKGLGDVPCVFDTNHAGPHRAATTA